MSMKVVTRRISMSHLDGHRYCISPNSGVFFFGRETIVGISAFCHNMIMIPHDMAFCLIQLFSVITYDCGKEKSCVRMFRTRFRTS